MGAGLSEDDDGGMQWWAEQGQAEQWEAERQAVRDSQALEAHRKWKEQFFNNMEVSNAEHQ